MGATTRHGGARLTGISWPVWLGVLIALLAAGEGVGWLLGAQGWAAAGGTVAWVGRLLAAAWVGYGLWRWREVIWVKRVTGLVSGTVIAALLYLFFTAINAQGMAIATAGVYFMAAGFFVGLFVVRLILSGPHPVLSIARTLVDEAIRMKVALVFIVALLLLVPALPLAMDQEQLLKYRIQSFLTYAMIAVGTLLSLMTIFLAVGTITRELQDKQIFLTMSKPVGRGQYLLGKWLGIALLNLLLVGVAGGGIYGFTQMLAGQEAASQADRESVRQEVLAARVANDPQPRDVDELRSRLDQRLTELQRQSPGEYGQPGTPIHDLPRDVQRFVERQVHAQWLSVAPRQSRTYVFTDVRPPADELRMVQLRLKPEAAGDTIDGYVYLNVDINGRPYHQWTGRPFPRLADDNYHVLQIPAQAIDNGRLEVTITNAVLPGDVAQPTITFDVTDGLQVLYQAGGFEANLVRSLAMIWLRLCFLAMLGLAAGTFLGFPTACLTAILIFIAATSSSFIYESIEHYTVLGGEGLASQLLQAPGTMIALLGEGQADEVLRVVLALIGSIFLALVPALGEFNPTELLADGQLVDAAWLGRAVMMVGLLWTGGLGLIAWAIFRRRELAQVTV